MQHPNNPNVPEQSQVIGEFQRVFISGDWGRYTALENIRKHEIDFADVPEMFEAPMLIELDDRFD